MTRYIEPLTTLDVVGPISTKDNDLHNWLADVLHKMSKHHSGQVVQHRLLFELCSLGQGVCTLAAVS